MSSVRSRAEGAIIASMVADAAAAPVHWIYDLKALQEIIKKNPGGNPEFIEPSRCPFYKISTGQNTCYGDQIYSLLQSLIECKGFNKEMYKKKLYETFGPKSKYDIDQTISPKPGPYRNGCIRIFLENYEKDKTGKTGRDPDPEADGFIKVVPLVALYAGKPDMLKIVEEALRVTQEDNSAIAAALAAAKLLEHYILNGKTENAIDEMNKMADATVAKSVKEIMEFKSMKHDEAVEKFGSSCSLPGSFQCAIHAIVNSDGNFISTIRTELCSAGDMVSRAVFVGACLGAWSGPDSVPQDWLSRMEVKDVPALAKKLVELR